MKHVSCLGSNNWGGLHHSYCLSSDLHCLKSIRCYRHGSAWARNMGYGRSPLHPTLNKELKWKTTPKRPLDPSPALWFFLTDENNTVCVYLSASCPDDIWKRLPATSGSGGARWPHPLGCNQEGEMCCKQQQSARVLCFNGFKNQC